MDIKHHLIDGAEDQIQNLFESPPLRSEWQVVQVRPKHQHLYAMRSMSTRRGHSAKLLTGDLQALLGSALILGYVFPKLVFKCRALGFSVSDVAMQQVHCEAFHCVWCLITASSRLAFASGRSTRKRVCRDLEWRVLHYLAE